MLLQPVIAVVSGEVLEIVVGEDVEEAVVIEVAAEAVEVEARKKRIGFQSPNLVV